MFGNFGKRNTERNTVGSFAFTKPTSRKKPAGMGRGVQGRVDVNTMTNAIKALMNQRMNKTGGYIGVHISDKNNCDLGLFLKFAVNVGLQASSENQIASLCSELLGAARNIPEVSKPSQFRGVYAFSSAEDFINYFVQPVTLGVFRNKGVVKSGRIEYFLNEVVKFIQAFGTKGSSRNPSIGFDSYDWAILAAGSANLNANVPQETMERFNRFSTLSMGFLGIATTARSFKTYTSVRSRLDWPFKAGTIAEMTIGKIFKTKANSPEQLAHLDTLQRAAAIVASSGSAKSVASSLGAIVVKSGGLRSRVGDSYLMKSLVEYFGGAASFSGANAFEFGTDKKVKVGAAILMGSTPDQAFGNTAVKLSSRGMGGRILLYGFLQFMLNSIKNNPTEFARFSGRGFNEVAPEIEAILGALSTGGSVKSSAVAAYRKLTKGIIIYLRGDKGGFADLYGSIANNDRGSAERKAIANIVGITRVSAGPASKFSVSDIIGSGSRVRTTSGVGFSKFGVDGTDGEAPIVGKMSFRKRRGF